MFVPTITKLDVAIAANEEIADIKFVELTTRAEKYKWQMRFTKDYKGGLNPITDELFNETKVKCLVATCPAGKELGYMRLVDEMSCFEPCNDGAWCLEDAYVKPAYRSKKVMRNMLQYAINSHHVKLVHITCDRYWANRYYFNDLGFNQYIRVDDTDLGFIVHDSYGELLEKLSLIAA
jgi:hypothetical protein